MDKTQILSALEVSDLKDAAFPSQIPGFILSSWLKESEGMNTSGGRVLSTLNQDEFLIEAAVGTLFFEAFIFLFYLLKFSHIPTAIDTNILV